ncbi:MAG: HDIG domain-containing protein [Planctomycetes bacterium]|nr:HDIG domain-containing protein [Planctomycetota bacterium]
MAQDRPSYEESLTLLRKYNQNQSLIKHGLAVAVTMRHFAELWGEDAETWEVVGLIHDLDYGQFPDQHCYKSAEILRDEGWPQDLIRAVQSHGWGICTEVEPQTRLEKTLYAVDELTGLIAAVALVRPSKSVRDVKVKSVKKKWKNTAFAAGVSREIIQQGAEMLQMDLDELIQHTLAAMQGKAEALGLSGTESGSLGARH